MCFLLPSKCFLTSLQSIFLLPSICFLTWLQCVSYSPSKCFLTFLQFVSYSLSICFLLGFKLFSYSLSTCFLLPSNLASMCFSLPLLTHAKVSSDICILLQIRLLRLWRKRTIVCSLGSLSPKVLEVSRANFGGGWADFFEVIKCEFIAQGKTRYSGHL